jgi:hypothetical protein
MTVNGETRTVDRTAPVIDSDRAGESRPLLSKVVGNAAAAYSLRDLNDKQGNNKVVNVRRSSDNTNRDFLAKEVSNGTLEDWVNNFVNGVFQNTGYESFSNASASGFTASNTGSTGFAVSDIPDGSSGAVISVSFDISITNGSPSLSLRNNLTGSGTASNSVNYTSSGSKTATLTANQSYVGIGFTEGDVPSNFTVSNFKILGDGFVETWYDQSGNGNDVVQATASQQPKIVSSGSLITAGVTFDEANSTELVATDPVITAAAAGTYSTFSVQTISNTESGYLYGNASPTNGSSLYANSSIYIVSNKNSASGFDSISKGASEQLLSAVYNNNDAVMQVDGGGSTSDGSTYNFSAGTSNFIMGNRSGGTSTGTKLTGSIKEVIVYNSDQTANRPALEANIANQYGITLS